MSKKKKLDFKSEMKTKQEERAKAFNEAVEAKKKPIENGKAEIDT